MRRYISDPLWVLPLGVLILSLAGGALSQIQVIPVPTGGGSSNPVAVALVSSNSTSGTLTQTVLASAPAGTYRYTGGYKVNGAASDTCTLDATLAYTAGSVQSASLNDTAQLIVDNPGFITSMRTHVFTTSTTANITLTMENNSAPCATWDITVTSLLERVTAP